MNRKQYIENTVENEFLLPNYMALLGCILNKNKSVSQALSDQSLLTREVEQGLKRNKLGRK